ncbi:hypothetical protein ILUMI_10042 [Ignelater luminosus]|uniref:Uncharacterized protein n=1 Tax=Ignelater luminosus TaxID=2038154 RepID=A0A8K0GDZ5_IGNLU|nr:hypothetical protein ILUMI_10042 [Ignelater luminosus]
MSSRTDLLLFQLFVGICLFVSGKCQLCEDSKYLYPPIVTCKNVTGKFPEFTKAIASVRCYDCNIPVVDENTIAKFKGDTFNLSYSHVKNISSTAFKSFENTTHKFLFESNEITYIGPGVFSRFSALDEINLRNNKISTLPDGAFVDTNVGVLDLSHNQLSDINKTFKGLKVALLNLSYNEIANLDANTFDNTTFWAGRQWRTRAQQVDLSYNLITKIDPNTFKAVSSETSLRSLFFKNNRITTIENNTFSQLAYLSTLTLEDNYISELYTDSFKGLKRLSNLYLKNNKIEKIPQSIFADLQTLEFLDLSDNFLTTLSSNTFSGLTFLTKLNISHNNLKVLDDVHLFPLGRLMSLDISNNKLKDLNLPVILEHHYKLRVLVINDNFWTCKHLVRMYKLINERMGGFNYPAHHYDVPNLHGIACSRTELNSYDMTFDDFLNVISQDRIFEDIFDDKINNEYSDLLGIQDVVLAIKSVRSIFYMFLIVVIIMILLLTQFIVRCIYQYWYRRNTVPSDKFCFSYAPNQDNVELI